MPVSLNTGLQERVVICTTLNGAAGNVELTDDRILATDHVFLGWIDSRDGGLTWYLDEINNGYFNVILSGAGHDIQVLVVREVF